MKLKQLHFIRLKCIAHKISLSNKVTHFKQELNRITSEKRIWNAMQTMIQLSQHKSELRGPLVSDSTSQLEAPQFKSRPTIRKSLLRVFICSWVMETLTQSLKLGHDKLYFYSQFVFHLTTCHSMLQERCFITRQLPLHISRQHA